METIDKTMCVCGLPMLSTKGGGLYCENCDQSQTRELMGFGRVRTAHDVRFDLWWARRIGKVFGQLPDNVDVSDLYGAP